jgi:heat shock protein HslJ
MLAMLTSLAAAFGCSGVDGPPGSGERERAEEHIEGRSIIDRSRMTLNFGADGRLSGGASCDTYAAHYTLTGAGRKVSKAAGTLMACDPSSMHEVELFLNALGNARRFDLRPVGALMRHRNRRRTRTARR